MEPHKYIEINRGLHPYPGLPLPRISNANGFSAAASSTGAAAGTAAASAAASAGTGVEKSGVVGAPFQAQ
jgi:hypothetical protein